MARNKSESLSIRTTAEIKDLVRLAAERERRSVASMIDQQLRQAGWEADSVALKYNKGARPEKNRHHSIAEWPTESGPADYVLFVGLTPVAVVEAKRNVDVSGALQQAKR